MLQQTWKLGIVAVVLLALVGTAVGIVAAQTGDDATPTPTVTSESDATATAQDEATATPKADQEADATATPSTDAEEDADATPTEKEALRDQFLDDLAERLGVSRDQLDQALSDSALALVDQAVADGRITEEEAARIRERIAAGEFPFLFGHHGFRHRGPCGLFGANLEDVAGFLGIEPADVRNGLEDGQSLAQIAEAHGKSRDELKSFLIDNVKQRLDDAVANDRITQERADELLQDFTDRVDDLIDREGLPLRPHKFFEPDEENEGEEETEGASLTI